MAQERDNTNAATPGQPGETTEAFGRRCVGSIMTPSDLLTLEQHDGLSSRFRESDTLVEHLLVRLLAGEHVVAAHGSERSHRRLSFIGLSDPERHLLDERWSVPHLNGRGVWFLPEHVTLHVGQMQLPWSFLHRGPYAGTLIDEERYRATLAETADAVLLWAVFEPLCQTLFLPFVLRGSQVGTYTRDQTRALWGEVDALLAALGVDLARETAVMRYGGGWSKLHATEQRAAKLRLVQALAQQAHPDLAGRYRAFRLQALLAQYYNKAKDGYALRKQVITKVHQPTLVAYFGGDWLAFLDYLGERPHPDEEIVTTLPEPRLYVGTSGRVQTVAAQTGIAPEEVAKIAGSLWQSAQIQSPIEERTRVLGGFWQVFDVIHARQAPGMPSLWGLVEDERPVLLRDLSHTPYQPRLYLTLFPANLLVDIRRFWGRVLLPSYPERIVSEPYPHALLASAVGPALRFWNGCALTAWFLCEGPYSRTDMAGLAAYHARDLAALAELGTPIHPSLFDELIREESRLGPSQPIVASRDTSPVARGISITFTTYAGSRRAGFERLRDIITRHRQGWAGVFWQHYMRARWESELRAASQAFSEMVARDGKPPTAKQFAKTAATPTNHWFGGDISLLYAAIGETSPLQPVASLRLPPDPLRFADSVRRALYDVLPDIATAARQKHNQNPETSRRVFAVDLLAEQSLRYVQLYEGLGRPPDLKEFGRTRLHDAAEAAEKELEALWALFAACVQDTLTTMTA